MAQLGTFLPQEDLLLYTCDYGKVQLVSTETYNEFELKNTIDKLDRNIVGAIAIQLAIVGYGNKTYGSVIVDGKIIEIKDFFKKNNIKSDLNINSKLKPADLTPRRLIRFYRYTIADYLRENVAAQSYLFKKYCLAKSDTNRIYIYPGFEHVAEPVRDDNNVKELLQTYKYLDSRLNTHIAERIVRVLVARGFNGHQFETALT